MIIPRIRNTTYVLSEYHNMYQYNINQQALPFEDYQYSEVTKLILFYIQMILYRRVTNDQHNNFSRRKLT